MLKYAKITDKKTKQCEVGLGTNVDFYKKIGMTELDVEQGYDGGWYLKGYAPQKPLEDLKKDKIQELKDKRDEYKKTIIINNYTLYEIDNSNNLKFNIIMGVHPFTAQDKADFKREINFISAFYDNKKEEINNATSKTNLAKIDLVFKKEEKEE